MPYDMERPLDILLCQRFLPEFGGSIRWMYEVYRRWPGEVEVITHDYYGHPPHTPEFPGAPERPPAGDHVTDPNLKMDRRDIFMRDWGLESPRRLGRYLRMTSAVRARLKAAAHRGRTIRLHAIHAVPEVASLVPLKWLHGRRLQIICYVHGEEVTACCSSRQLRWLMHRAHGIVDLMLANSRYTQGVVAPHIDPRKVHVVNPGVELAEFAPAEQAGQLWRKEQGLAGRPVVLTVGRLDPRKNHRAVIQAVAALKVRYPGLIYLMAGEGRARPDLEALAARLGVADRVRFLGNVGGAAKVALYGACDIFAMPAIRDGTDVEGFGMVFLEAGVCGKACLAGGAGGQAEAVVDGKTGLVVDGTDQEAVTAGLERLLGDPGLRSRLGQAGREHAAGYDWPRVVQRIVELVESMG